MLEFVPWAEGLVVQLFVGKDLCCRRQVIGLAKVFQEVRKGLFLILTEPLYFIVAHQ